MMKQTIQRAAKLTDSILIGDIQLKNRIAMAPLTRMRGDSQTGVPNDLMKQYYEQRAGFGLIITEASQISEQSECFPGSGGIYTQQQIEGWKKITDRVHELGSKIFIQIVHCGRAIAQEHTRGYTPISSTNQPIPQLHRRMGTPHPIPKEMTQDDIKMVIEQFRQACVNAKEAGFDGVQLHGANGYLVDQFLRDGANQRTDEYGGSIENRARFLLEVLDSMVSVYGNQRVSVRLSPTGRINGMYESNPIDLMKYVLKEIEKRELSFVEIKRHGILDETKKAQMQTGKQFNDTGKLLPEEQVPDFFKQMRQLYKGVLMANDGFDPESAQQVLDDGYADLVSFGKLAISNPDLPQRITNGHNINFQYDFNTFYNGTKEGYTDYPFYEQQQQE